jgi:DNA-binding NtrC family response regulator
MPLSLQAKLLRFLQAREFERVGATVTLQSNVRIVTATNRDLIKEVREGRFREDLYHRLAVILIHVPSLNDRKEDIPLLAEHFLTIVCADHGVPRKSFTDDALLALQQTDWTGNIRELRNIVERLVILSGAIINGQDVRMFANPGK